MNFEMQQSIALLKDLLWLKVADLELEDREQVDNVVNDMLQVALDDANRLLTDWTRERAALAERVVEAQEQAARDLIAAEEKEQTDALQAEVDQAQRDERLRAGVS